MQYFRDVNNGFVVRKPEDCMYLEYTYSDIDNWNKTEPDDSYEREYWLGQGNNCLFEISEEEAFSIIKSRNENIKKAKTKEIKAEKVDEEKAKVFSENIHEQMVDAIVGPKSQPPTEKEKELRKNLSMRALEYLMFMDEE